MAPPAGTLRVGRYFLALLAIFVVLFGIVFWPGQRHTPKLGLDLEGGTQVTFQARLPSGKVPSKSSMLEAQQIMEQRVNGYGVSNAEVVVQGSNQIVISVPGKSASDIASIGTAAVLNFRPVVMPPVTLAAVAAAESSATATPTASASVSGSTASTPPASASGSSTASSSATSSSSSTSSKSGAADAPATSPASAQALDAQPLAAGPSPNPGASDTIPFTVNPTESPTLPSVPSSVTATPPTMNYCVKPAVADTGKLPTCANPLASLGFTVPTTDTAFAALSATQQTALQAAVSQFQCSSKPTDDSKASTLLACDSSVDSTATTAFLLGSIVVPGSEISSASAVAPGSTAGQTDWQVNLNLKTTGARNWAKFTAAHNIGTTNTTTADVTTCGASATPCFDFVAFTLDGTVLETPVTEGAITTPTTTISGGFNQSGADQLAQQLNYGALPLSFTDINQSTVSASLGSGQLKDGLLAGGIGLVLVVIYSLIYYRGLGIVTIASLLVSGGLTYASLVILGHEIGFTLTLAGIAGFIVAVGITADSFVVFFERIKDEVHEGRSMRVAVPRAWIRARRTILSADTVSFLAAATLYYFAAGDVQGFAFTLGLSTILDLVVVFLFTHPMLSFLSRSATFGSARFSGLDSAREGGINLSAETGTWRPRQRPARAVGSRPHARGQAQPARSNVAVLDDEGIDYEEVFDDTETGSTTAPEETFETDATSLNEPEALAPVDGSADHDDPAAASDVSDAPIVKSTTTAAERAAARRARMRAKPDGGKS